MINSILKEQKDNEVIKFVLNMTIKDWIDVFTFKKTIYNFRCVKQLNLCEYEEIQKKIPSIKTLFDNILEKNQDDFYFSKFVFYLYNYENWFLNKRGRNRK